MVVICPRTLKLKVFNLTAKLGESLGMSIPIAKKSIGPQTHWGCHNWAGEQFISYMLRETYHPQLDPADVDKILDECIISIGVTRYKKKLIKRDHLEYVLKKHKLQKMVNVSDW